MVTITLRHSIRNFLNIFIYHEIWFPMSVLVTFFRFIFLDIVARSIGSTEEKRPLRNQERQQIMRKG